MSLKGIAMQNVRRLGTAVTGLFGAVTGIDSTMIPKNNASDCLDVDTEDGVAKPRRGFRNILASDASQSTLKGAHWCQVYSASVLKEAFVTFDYNRDGSGKLRPYELAYTLATDTWAKTEITKGGVSLDLNNTYWRCGCFGSKAYFINPNDSHPVNSYTPGTVNSWAPVEPPASPTGAPAVDYYLNPSSRAYAKYLGASASYAAGDVTTDATVADTVTLTGQAVKVLIKADGHFTATFNIKHSAAVADFTYSDVFTIDVTVNDTNKIQPLLKTLKFSMTSSTGPVTQELQASVVSETNDTNGKLKSVKFYLKFSGKGTRATWATATTLLIEGEITGYSANDYLFFSPLTAGGMVNWGDKQERLMYTRYESSTLFESGPSLAKNLDRVNLDGQYLTDTSFPMGTVPLVTMVAASDSDTLRLYVQQVDNTKKTTAWKRVVSQSDATTTYTFALSPEDFAALTEYAPSDFSYTGVQNLFPFRQSMCWLYPGSTNNVRFSRYGNAIAQASDSDAFRTDLGQDDDFRGVNFTLSGATQDQPVCGLELGGVAVIWGSLGAYLVADTENGLPKGFSPPKPIPNAPGIHGPEAFCVFEDPTDRTPIVVYLVQGGDSWQAIRVPIGVTIGTLQSVSTYEYSMLVRGSADTKEFGSSALRDSEAAHVYAKGKDNSLHLRYNTREIVSRRPDLLEGKRPWQFYNYGTGQYGDQWQKIRCVQSSIGWLHFGFRLNGAVDEFEQANMKHPTTGDRMYVDIDGSSRTPASLVAATDVVTFTLPPPWSSGTAVTVATTGNGLTAGVTYYYNRITTTTCYFYDTQAHAQAGGATGRMNLTGATWAAGAVTPLGPDDGSAFAVAPYWTTKTFADYRRRLRKVKVDKVSVTDPVIVTVVSDRQTSSPVTIASGDQWAKFGPKQSGDKHTITFTLSERHSGIRGFETEEAVISQSRHK